MEYFLVYNLPFTVLSPAWEYFTHTYEYNLQVWTFLPEFHDENSNPNFRMKIDKNNKRKST
jgi:hypothetical protein